MAEAYLEGVDPLYDNIEAFNRWMDEDWGFQYKDRIYAPAMLSLRDVERAVAELDRVLAAGAKFIMLYPGPAYGRSPGDPYFDPFWARVNEAKVAGRRSRIFQRHVKVVPYPEDDTVGLVEKLGSTECLVMGSDWPHAEGLREPADFFAKVEGLGEENRRRFLRDNGRELLGLS